MLLLNKMPHFVQHLANIQSFVIDRNVVDDVIDGNAFILNSFFRENERMLEFAHAVQQKLNQYKADDATMGEVCNNEDFVYYVVLFRLGSR